MPKAHFSMEATWSLRERLWSVLPNCGVWADAFVHQDEYKRGPPFNIRASAYFQGQPCVRCAKRAKALGLAWPPGGKVEAARHG